MPDPTSADFISLASTDVIWVISVTQSLAIAVLLWLHWQVRREMEDSISDVAHESETSFCFLRENLAAYKIESDRAYASHRRVSAIERRLADHDGVLDEINQRTAKDSKRRLSGPGDDA